MSTTVKVNSYPTCDLCKALGESTTTALYDGRTLQGFWAYMCQRHFESFGVGLGMGRGQLLLLEEDA